MAVAVQIIGLLLMAAGMYIWFGIGPALVGSGVLVTAAGTSLEIDRRKKLRGEA